MKKLKLNDFYNDGLGWICKHCERELNENKVENHAVSRLLSEGEAESKKPEISTIALAKWADASHRTLVCPRCGITELADKY